MEDPSLFPMKFFYDKRNMNIEINYDQSKKRFLLIINNNSYFEFPHHLSGRIELNSVKLLDGRMAFNIENLRKLKRTSIGHNPITAVSLASINCTSNEDLQQLFAFIAQGIDNVGGLHKLTF